MDSGVVEAKLESLGRCVHRVETTLPGSASELEADYDKQDIIAVNLQRAVQLSADVAGNILAEFQEPFPATTAELFERLARHELIDTALAASLRRAVGLRNIAVHEYRELDWTHLHTVIGDRIDDFRAFARAISTAMDPR